MVRESRNNTADEVGFQAFQFFLSFLLTLPLAAHWVAIWLGWRIFFLADPWIQLVWAALLQLVCGWPFVAGALRGQGARRSFDGLIALGTWLLFGYGLYLTVRRPDVATHPYFQMQSVLLLAVTLDRLTVAVLARRRHRAQ
ncbi:MAG: hypothetical protein K0R39_4969 [Symbiobacteriaceae bacterium]|jgi:cation transport ATPase|nr:hypothetical protein [Symbiobacteriaceae bacterium]